MLSMTQITKNCNVGMSKREKLIKKIQSYSKERLEDLWRQILSDEKTDWNEGIAFEFLILRFFELEGAEVRYPFTVGIQGESVAEQIDGVVHLNDIQLSILMEFKDHSKNINIEPVAKLRNQLLRRPSNAIGAIFSTTGFTNSTILLAQFLAPQTILLWEKNNIEHCISGNCSFKDGMLKKYRHAIEEGNPALDLTKIK